MAESDHKPSNLTQEMMMQYSALGNDLRFYAEQRFKIAGAFLVASGLLANAATTRGAWGLALVGIALSYLCLSWDRYTSSWWWGLIATVEEIERKGIEDGTLIEAYKKYRNFRDSATLSICRPWLRATEAIIGIYVLAIIAWAWWLSWILGVLALLVSSLIIYKLDKSLFQQLFQKLKLKILWLNPYR